MRLDNDRRRVGQPCGGQAFPARSALAKKVAAGILLAFILAGSDGGLPGLLPAQGVETDPLALANRSYQTTKAQLRSRPNDDEAGWQFGRACFDLADVATNSDMRADIASQGIAACEKVLARSSNSVGAHYYLGMDQCQLARTRGLSAFKLIKSIQREFTTCLDLDEKFDFAGPDRNLGLLYRDAPAIASIGSRSRARQHLQRAAELAPEYPENGLNLTESCLDWSDRNGARRALKALEEAWPKARARLTGPDWSASWKDWEARLAKVKKKVEDPARALESPRGLP